MVNSYKPNTPKEDDNKNINEINTSLSYNVSLVP